MKITEKTMTTNLVDEIASRLDITKEQYQLAVSHYVRLAEYLSSVLDKELHIYPQGSFMLGTVIKPYIKEAEADFDVDLVCEFTNDTEKTIFPKDLKKIVGDALKQSEVYSSKLDKEGKRCWTLKFPKNSNTGFHMDCLPCIPFTLLDINKKINLTHTSDFHNYEWRKSNPLELKEWFYNQQKTVFQDIREGIFNADRSVYNSIDEVPENDIKTPLQRVIQLLKRHRDVYFSDKENEKYKPISMIITILAAELYEQEVDSYITLKNIIEELSKYEEIFRNPTHNSGAKNKELIRFDGNKWYIINPVAQEENFAEYWHEDDHARAKAFFEWVSVLKFNFLRILESLSVEDFQRGISSSLKLEIPRDVIVNLGLVEQETLSRKYEDVPRVEVSIIKPVKPYRR